ncbi:hypothetical protein SAMN05444008_107249 [Cnuella takakiae]|uniref:Uncharacterized protein n=1 Tax=Cnuella takakiae TaxID=1302690 RepID=A0A1M5BC44_9BACT|nr:hypothetical protein [Cnuella takakiae]SHF40084.1 hypothetical protein SAMN05444008_107249 [Cnuella takakiae]
MQALQFVTKLLVILYCCNLAVACSSTSQINYQSTKDLAYQPRTYQKIMVLARIDKAEYRQRTEAALVQSLDDLDQKAIPATGNITQGYAQDSAAFLAQLKSMGVDGVFVINYLGEQTVVKDEWRYNGGVYFAYGGAYAPFDLDTK